MKVFRAIAMTHFCVCRRCNKTNMPTTLQHLGSLLCFYIQVQILRTFQNLMIKTENSKSIIISDYIQICIWKKVKYFEISQLSTDIWYSFSYYHTKITTYRYFKFIVEIGFLFTENWKKQEKGGMIWKATNAYD